jgi:hypothetical protein
MCHSEYDAKPQGTPNSARPPYHDVSKTRAKQRQESNRDPVKHKVEALPFSLNDLPWLHLIALLRRLARSTNGRRGGGRGVLMRVWLVNLGAGVLLLAVVVERGLVGLVLGRVGSRNGHLRRIGSIALARDQVVDLGVVGWDIRTSQLTGAELVENDAGVDEETEEGEAKWSG